MLNHKGEWLSVGDNVFLVRPGALTPPLKRAFWKVSRATAVEVAKEAGIEVHEMAQPSTMPIADESFSPAPRRGCPVLIVA
jgi:branched-subunit amino acid aminotransferase/4-amino-4-deoxychorismate lyase